MAYLEKNGLGLFIEFRSFQKLFRVYKCNLNALNNFQQTWDANLFSACMYIILTPRRVASFFAKFSPFTNTLLYRYRLINRCQPVPVRFSGPEQIHLVFNLLYRKFQLDCSNIARVSAFLKIKKFLNLVESKKTRIFLNCFGIMLSDTKFFGIF